MNRQLRRKLVICLSEVLFATRYAFRCPHLPRPSVLLQLLIGNTLNDRVYAREILSRSISAYFKHPGFLDIVIPILARSLYPDQDDEIVLANASAVRALLDSKMARKLKVKNVNQFCAGLVEGMKTECLHLRLEMKSVTIRLMRRFPAKMISNLTDLIYKCNHVQKTCILHLLILYLLETRLNEESVVNKMLETSTRMMVSSSPMVRRAAIELVYVVHHNGTPTEFLLAVMRFCGASKDQIAAVRCRIARDGGPPMVVDEVAMSYEPLQGGEDGSWVLRRRLSRDGDSDNTDCEVEQAGMMEASGRLNPAYVLVFFGALR